MPWKNGLGETAEIERTPQATDPYLWRLSQAWIKTDSPFSAFPGFDRWLVVWRGEGIYLNETKLEPLQPFHFSGDAGTRSRLVEGPVVDLGLIYDRKQVEAKMRFAHGRIELETGWTHYVFDTSEGDTLKVDGAEILDVTTSIWISARKKTAGPSGS